jgi:ketosteroid isomerase-like protein
MMPARPEVDVQALRAELEELRKLRQDVRYLRDRQQIREVVALYGRAQDRVDWELFASVFHSDAIFDSGALMDFVGDSRQLAARAEERLNREFITTSHVMTNHLCEIDGDVAHAETYATTYLVTKDGKYVRSTHARYVDRLERRDGRWKIALRRIVRNALSRAEVVGEPRPEGKRDRSDPSYQRPLTLPPERAALIKP